MKFRSKKKKPTTRLAIRITDDLKVRLNDRVREIKSRYPEESFTIQALVTEAIERMIA